MDDKKNIELATHVEHVSDNASSNIADESGEYRQNHLDHDEDDDFKLTFGKVMAMLAFQTGYMADVMLITMLSAALTPINRAVGPDVNYSWMAVSQAVGSAALATPMGRFGDIFGRRNFLMAGSVLSMVGCAIAATANTVNTIIIGVAFTGVGCSMHQLAWTCIGEPDLNLYR